MAFHRFARMLALFALGTLVACSGEEGSEAGELPDEVAVVVGVEGGEVRAKGVTLEIPPGALAKKTTITARPTSKPTPGAVKVLSKVYEFGPEGTTFSKEVKVTFETEKTERSVAVYFTKEGSSNFEKLPSTRKEKQVSAKVKHFSLGFAGAPEEGELPEDDAGTENDFDASTTLPDAGSIDDPDAATAPGPVPGAKRIRVMSTDRYGRPENQTWAAYRDGDGAWQALTPTLKGDYQFDVREDTYAVAFVCADAEANSEGVVLLAPSSRSTQHVEATTFCVTAIPAEYTLSGGLTLSTSSDRFVWGHSFGDGTVTLPVGGPPPSYTIQNLPAGVTVDPVVAVVDGNSFLMQAHILRDLRLTGNQTLALDLASQSYGLMSAQFSVSGASAETNLTAHLATRNANQGLSLGWRGGIIGGTTTRTLSYQYLTNLSLLPADNYVFEAIEQNASATRWARLRTKMSGNVSLELPTSFSALFALDGESYLLPKMQFDSVLDAIHYRLTVSYNEGPVRTFSVQAEPEWLTLSQGPPPGNQAPEHELQLPDLTSAPGFDTNWLHPAQSTVDLTGAVRRSTNSMGGVLESHSSRTESSLTLF